MKTAILVLLMLSLQACTKDPEVRGYTIVTDMVHSPAYEAFSENELTPNGQTMMMPVKGTIARGKMPHPYTNSVEDSEKAGEELIDPYPETERSIARGAYLYQSFCVPCHGVSGEGDGPVVAKKFPGPPSLKSRDLRTYSKGRLYHAITVGFGDMPSHGEQITRQDRWYLAQYLKQFQK